MHQVTEILIVVQSIADNKLVCQEIHFNNKHYDIQFHTWNFKTHIIWNIAGTQRSSLPEQTGNLHTLRVVPSLRVVR